MIYILLIIIGIILIKFNSVVNLKVKTDNESFFNTMKCKEEEFTDYDMELVAIRKDMAESILDLQQEIQELRERLNDISKYKINSPNNIKLNNKEDDIKKNYGHKDIITEINFNNLAFTNNNEKVKRIKLMIEQGKNDEEICNSLKIGKGEVLLIRGLEKV